MSSEQQLPLGRARRLLRGEDVAVLQESTCGCSALFKILVVDFGVVVERQGAACVESFNDMDGINEPNCVGFVRVLVDC